MATSADIRQIFPNSATLASYIITLCSHFLICTERVINYLLHRLNELTCSKCLESLAHVRTQLMYGNVVVIIITITYNYISNNYNDYNMLNALL